VRIPGQEKERVEFSLTYIQGNFCIFIQIFFFIIIRLVEGKFYNFKNINIIKKKWLTHVLQVSAYE
jgi:hypothetical protein